MKKLHILFVSEYFYPKAAGGEVWSFELCAALAHRGHKVTVITTNHGGLKQEEVVGGVRILRPVRTTGKEQSRIRRKIAILALLRQVRRFVERNAERIDIVHAMAYTMNVGTSRIALQYGIPCVTSVHSYFGKDWQHNAPMRMVLGYLERSALIEDKARIIQVPSKYMQQRIKDDLGKKTTVIHNWTGARFPKPKALAPNTCLFIGSLEPIKNPLAAIDAAKVLGAQLLVIGSGSLEQDMREAVKKAGLKCRFIPAVSRDDALANIAGSSLVLIPSITESFSLVALEAVAQGTPVSGNPVGILPELPGVIPFPPSAIPARLSPDAQEKARQQFSKEKAIEEFERLYKKLTK
jgi:D-inositol-3-phosphate glycosyltransferase